MAPATASDGKGASSRLSVAFLLLSAVFFLLSNSRCEAAAVADPQAGGSKPAQVSNEELLAILREEARQKQMEQQQHQQQQQEHQRPTRDSHLDTKVSLVEPSAKAPSLNGGVERVREEVFQTLERIPEGERGGGGGADEEERHKTDGDGGQGNRHFRLTRRTRRRQKRNIADDLGEVGKRRHLATIDSLRSAALLPSEPLSARVADDHDTPLQTHRQDKSRRQRHGDGGGGHRHRRRHQRHSRRRVRRDASSLSSRIADEDLYELFVDYFENELNLRRKRSILGDLGSPKSHPMHVDFPQAERVKQSPRPQSHHVVNSIVPPGLDPSDPANVLTHEDVRDVTRGSDLGQILNWLEALSQGREHDVTAALLVAKKKRKKSSSSSSSSSKRHHQSSNNATASHLTNEQRENRARIMANSKGQVRHALADKGILPNQGRPAPPPQAQAPSQPPQTPSKGTAGAPQHQIEAQLITQTTVVSTASHTTRPTTTTTTTTVSTTTTSAARPPFQSTTTIPTIPFVPRAEPVGPVPMPPPFAPDRAGQQQQQQQHDAPPVRSDRVEMGQEPQGHFQQQQQQRHEHKAKPKQTANRVPHHYQGQHFAMADDTSERDGDSVERTMETTKTKTKEHQKRKKNHSKRHHRDEQKDEEAKRNRRRKKDKKRRRDKKRREEEKERLPPIAAASKGGFSIENDYIEII